MEQPEQTPIPGSQPPEPPSHPAETVSQSPQLQQPPSTAPSSSIASSISSSVAPPRSPSFTSNPNPTQFPRPVTSPSPQQQQQLPQSLVRPPQTTYSRPWQQHSTFTHFPTTSSPLLSSSVPASSSSSLAVSAPQRGGMALGVPASSLSGPSPPSPSPSQPSAFSGSFGQQFGGLGRGTVGVSEVASNSNVSQVRSMQGTQGIGMMGTLGTGSQVRPSGMSGSQHQQRPAQTSLRPASAPSSQSPISQNFQGHSLMRASPVVQSTSTSQSMQSLNQPWLSSSAQGKPPLPPPSYRPQVSSPSLQQRSNIPQQQPQQHPSTPITSQPQQQQSLQQHHPQDQLQALRSGQQPLSHPHQLTRAQGLVNQKSSSLATAPQPTASQTGTEGKTVSAENEESGNRILGKRSIRELIQQIDPSEKLDPEVEDILADIAEDFVESITTFGCSLAKHRKSDTLEAKDILLHVERNWNIRPPGFCGDEIKTFRKPLTTDIHKERLAAVKKSMMATEAANARNSTGQGTVNAKSGQAKTPANPLASPTFNH